MVQALHVQYAFDSRLDLCMTSSSSGSFLAWLPAQLDWDRIGIGLSGLCAAHCLLTPFLLAALPLWPALGAAHAWLHPTLVAFLLPVTVFAIWNAHRHGDALPTSLLLSLGFVLITVAWLGHDQWGPVGEAAGTLLGSGMLIAGHALNWRRHRSTHHHTQTASDGAPPA